MPQRALKTTDLIETNPVEAEHIVLGARRRVLGMRPAWRLAAIVLWSAFLGAVISINILVLAPDDWELPMMNEHHLAISFALTWLVGLIPAAAASLLSMPPRKHHDTQ